MSWMDSWSRPSKSARIPAPYYVTNTNLQYCRTCGRVISSKKSTKKQCSEIRYCSDRCRSRRPGAEDRRIEHSIASLLDGEDGSGVEKTAARSRVVKGDPRMIVTCDEIEEVVFGNRFDPEKTFGRRKNRRARGVQEKGEWKSVDMESSEEEEAEGAEVKAGTEEDENQQGHHDNDDSDDDNGVPLTEASQATHVRPPQPLSDINFSAGGGERGWQEKIQESAEDLQRRREGIRRAVEREMVRQAARRLIVFGVEVPEGAKGRRDVQMAEKPGKRKSKKRDVEAKEEDENHGAENFVVMRKAEALMYGQAVEPSFAKGNWSVRWRE